MEGNNVVETVFEDLGPADLRDPENRELKRIADRFSRYARDNFGAPIAVAIYADDKAEIQSVSISRQLPVEVIEEGTTEPEEASDEE